MVTILLNALCLIILAFALWVLFLFLDPEDYKVSDRYTGHQSERQQRNDDYNTDYFI